MHVEEMFRTLKSVLNKDRCVEFDYYPRRNEVVARIILGDGMNEDEFFAIYGVLKKFGFSDLWISGEECDFLEERHVPSELVFRAEDVDRDLAEFLFMCGQRYVVCRR